MRVQVYVPAANRYQGVTLTYEAPDDIALGDTVRVPITSFTADGDIVYEGVVDSLSSGYAGPCKHIRKIVRKASQ